MRESDTFNSTNPRGPQFASPARHKRVCGVALDMDGLLFDTERLYWIVADELLMRRGARFCRDLQARMMGRVGVAAIGEMINFHGLDDTPDSLLTESDALFEAMLGDQLAPMPGLGEFIDWLKRTGLPFGLATSSRRKFVEIILGTVDWSDSLTFILTGDDVTHGKPHPEMYLKAAQHLGIPPTKMLVFEDSGNGTAAAVAAGAITVSIPSEHTRDQDFSGARLIAESLVDRRIRSLVDA